MRSIACLFVLMRGRSTYISGYFVTIILKQKKRSMAARSRSCDC